MTSYSQQEARLVANRDIKKVRRVAVLQKRCVFHYPTMSPKREHQSNAKPGLWLKEKGPD